LGQAKPAALCGSCQGLPKAGFGGLVLCAKKDELATWQAYAKETNREDSLLVFDTSGNWVFPFLQYEIERLAKAQALPKISCASL
jgi:hypothetical protein